MVNLHPPATDWTILQDEYTNEKTKTVQHLLVRPTVYDCHNIVNSDGGLGDIRRQHDFCAALRRVAENLPSKTIQQPEPSVT